MQSVYPNETYKVVRIKVGNTPFYGRLMFGHPISCTYADVVARVQTGSNAGLPNDLEINLFGKGNLEVSGVFYNIPGEGNYIEIKGSNLNYSNVYVLAFTNINVEVSILQDFTQTTQATVNVNVIPEYIYNNTSLSSLANALGAVVTEPSTKTTYAALGKGIYSIETINAYSDAPDSESGACGIFIKTGGIGGEVLISTSGARLKIWSRYQGGHNWITT